MFHPLTIGAILGMALATYACRGGGYWLFTKIRPTARLHAILAYLPGTLFVSYVAPPLFSGGAQTWIGAVATIAAMAVTGNVMVAVFGGTAVAWAVWALE